MTDRSGSQQFSSALSNPAPTTSTQSHAPSATPTQPTDADGSRQSKHHPVQIGIAPMLILVVVAAVISAGLVYAAKIPEIQEELSVLFGTPVTADRSRRGPQILFILFTVTSPLLLAGMLSLGTLIWGKLTNR
ncbi:hypothetical protein [Rhodopirellula sallentina]|uniref:Membrane protein n=1 Tax=Rhodopirellula sallentina SM41 TaxID=1263870 RepID=M5UHT5_9BACT|nr:hypothetical protein [Rhodopirellula sallentina]EMI57406.1 membrane protein [Rhodopirellula sallentina SM41]